MSLMLHAGADPVTYDELRLVPTPDATKTHVPLPHHRFVDMIKNTLGYYGHIISSIEMGVTPDGNRMFGIMNLESEYDDYTDICGFRNSHDKSFPAAVTTGNRVFVCDNLAMIGEHTVKRRHTAKMIRDLPGLVMEMLEPLHTQREKQARKISVYKLRHLTDREADHVIMEAYRQDIINVQRIAEVQKEWQEPSYSDFEERSVWSLFNAFTHALNGRVVNNPSSTSKLFNVIDSTCLA